MYKWVKTPSPSFPKSTLNEYSFSFPNDNNLSNNELVKKSKMNNTWDKNDVVDTYIQHGISTDTYLCSMCTVCTPRSSRPRSKSMRYSRNNMRRPSWNDGIHRSTYLQLPADRSRELGSNIKNLNPLEPTRENSPLRKVGL